MKEQKKFYIYSAFSILNIGKYFSNQAIKPITYQPELDKETMFPKQPKIPKSLALKIEHELSLKQQVSVYGPILNANEYFSLKEIADAYKAEIVFIYLDATFDKLFEMYKEQKGSMDFEHFCNVYKKGLNLPFCDIGKITFEYIS